MKKALILIAIGIIILALDFWIPMGDAYPEMIEARDLGLEFQGKIVKNFIGEQPYLDVIPDLLGFILIFLGSALLAKKNYRFLLAMVLVPVASYLYIMLPRLPFDLQARELYMKTIGYSLLLVVVEIMIEFFVIHGIIAITNSMQNRWHNNELLIGWIIAMSSKGLLFIIDFFFGQKLFYNIYYIVLIVSTIFYLQRLYITTKFKLEEDK